MDEVCPSLFDDILEGISEAKGANESAGDEGISLGDEENGKKQHRSASIVHFAMMENTRKIQGDWLKPAFSFLTFSRKEYRYVVRLLRR